MNGFIRKHPSIVETMCRLTFSFQRIKKRANWSICWGWYPQSGYCSIRTFTKPWISSADHTELKERSWNSDEFTGLGLSLCGFLPFFRGEGPIGFRPGDQETSLVQVVRDSLRGWSFWECSPEKRREFASWKMDVVRWFTDDLAIRMVIVQMLH